MPFTGRIKIPYLQSIAGTIQDFFAFFERFALRRVTVVKCESYTYTSVGSTMSYFHSSSSNGGAVSTTTGSSLI